MRVVRGPPPDGRGQVHEVADGEEALGVVHQAHELAQRLAAQVDGARNAG
jgi:hypothetical protein